MALVAATGLILQNDVKDDDDEDDVAWMRVDCLILDDDDDDVRLEAVVKL